MDVAVDVDADVPLLFVVVLVPAYPVPVDF